MPRIPANYKEARALADWNRQRFYERVAEIRRKEAAERAINRSRPVRQQRDMSLPFDTAVDLLAAEDRKCKGYAADNKWYIQYANMYAQGELLEEMRRQNEELRLLRMTLEATREDA